MSSLRFATVLVGALGLAALAGCPSEPGTKVCPGTNILCPEEMYCGAVQPICLTTACGNGLIDPSEECDDGNVLPGDSCSPICKKEQCGNNVLDPNEVCDDGNAADGDGCNKTCSSKEVCGNGVVDVGEACDDGKSVGDPNATRNADGCSGTPVMVGTDKSPDACKSTEVCGNGIKDVQVGEVCDDGNTTSGDGCNQDCRSGEGCGNGFLDPGEQCDDGNANNNDDCLDTCKTAKCGDGVIDNMGTRNETCDAGTNGTPVETATCNIDCTTRACGDAKVNQTAGEQCDNGISGNGDTKNCTGGCLLNICGDGKVDMQPPSIEQCDDGNTNNTDGCSNACALASCGNSTVDMGEMCDDGNVDQTDACVMCHTAICGDGFIRTGVEQCDDGANLNGDGCSSSCRNEICGNSILDVNEDCDDGNTSNIDACTNGCADARCGDGFIRTSVEDCDDGNTVSNDGCSSTCHGEGCGNGTIEVGEQCDDNNTMSGDGCSSMCRFENCGDGIVNNGEQCDGNGAGTGGETAACNADCTNASCGDSKTNVTRGEQCDAGPGLNADNRDCTAMCKINICTDGLRDTLGPNHFEACDDGNMINTDGCNNSCTLASCGNGLQDPGEQCDDNNNINSDACVNCQNAVCGDGVVYAGVEQCDPPDVGNGCSLLCRNEVCGNGFVDPGEQCDDGNLLNGDGCSGNGHPTLIKCKFEFCGDGLDGNSELCDKSATGQAGTCNRDCTPSACGDGKLNPDSPANEQCDDGVVGAMPMTVMVSGDGCSATCKLERCGNNIIDTAAGEQCDPPNPGSGCSALCRSEVCGNGIRDTAAGEQCDDGNTSDTDGCVSDSMVPINCKVAVCGDGHVRTGVEDCDNGASNGMVGNGCSSLCRTVACGNGFKEQGEACDDGNQMGGDGCSANCQKIEVCGDGTQDAGEQCDVNANNSPTSMTFTGSCFPGCRSNTCGDGHVGGSETCDFGIVQNGQLACSYGALGCTVCTNSCASQAGTATYCGDGTMNGPIGAEDCDNGVNNTSDPDCTYGQVSCPARCDFGCNVLSTIPHTCGDGTCDVSNENVGSCPADCGFVLTVVKTGAGTGTVSGGSINCGATCTQTVAINGMVTLTASADAGSTFQSWGGACAGSGSCMVTLDAAKTVSANFTKVQRNITVTKTGTGASAGSVTVIPTGTSCGAGCTTHDDGTVVVLTASPGANNTFNSWTGCDSTAGAVCIVTMNGVEAVSASFTLAQFAVTVTTTGTGQGTVSSSPAGISCADGNVGTCTFNFDVGTNVTLTATPTAPDTAGWTMGPSSCTSAPSSPCAFTVSAVVGVEITFTDI